MPTLRSFGRVLPIAALLPVLTLTSAATAATPWPIPPAGYHYSTAAPCPLPETGPKPIYAICEDQMALLGRALDEARARHKLLLVEFGATWCGWCRALQRELPGDQVLGYREDSFDYAKAFHLVPIGASTLAVGKLASVPSGEAALKLVLDRAQGAEMRGWPFLAILDPEDSSRVFTRNTADLTLTGEADAGYDPGKLRAVLQEGYGFLREGKAVAPEPRRSWLARVYHWLID